MQLSEMLKTNKISSHIVLTTNNFLNDCKSRKAMQLRGMLYSWKDAQ